MIPVNMPQEPEHFNARVRQKGLSALDEMVGRAPRLSHRGRRRTKIANREQDIPSSAFPPYWRNALDDMLRLYGRKCAFLALYLEYATGNPTVDHMLPKSKNWQEIYEWSNYRLSAATINARKNDMSGIIDPFECRPGWFALELIGFQVISGPEAPKNRAAEMTATLELINAPECCRAREEYVESYTEEEISFDYLNRRAPFVASELRRLGRLHAGD